MNSIPSLIADLVNIPSSERAFNPYDTAFPGALTRRPTHLILFEAPGYRGCALSGIPVTSERVMLRGIEKWGLFGDGYQATSGQADGVSEMTATILWTTLAELADQPPLIWNTVPIHPHKPAQRQTNRPPTQAEKILGLGYLRRLLELFDIQQIMAAGRTAQAALAGLGIEAVPLRHPAQGGKPEFVRGMREVYRR